MEQPSQYMVHTVPSALPQFGTVCWTRALNLSVLAWRIGCGPLNHTENFYGRKKEEREIRGVEEAKSRIIYSVHTKRGS
jgi:hypothetical protein